MKHLMQDCIDWAEKICCALTICDKECKILYMNERSRATFARHGDIIGHDLMQYHPPHAQAKIREMLTEGTTNAYTISKGGIKKLVFQTPWWKDGEVGGLAEFSIPLPSDMPHYDRDKKN